MKNLMLALIIVSILAACGKEVDITGSAPTASPIPGAKGDKGDAGLNGANGSNGAKGDKGDKGLAGNNGTNGTNGTNGSNGANGANGVDGRDGEGASAGLLCSAFTILASDYSGTVNWDTLLSNGTLKFSTVFANFNVADQSDQTLFPGLTVAQQASLGTSNWALDCEGYLTVPESGLYSFMLSSDDGSEIAIDNSVVLNMPQDQPIASVTSAASHLFAGPHKFNLLYFQGPHVRVGLTLKWKGPSNVGMGTMSVVPASAFTH